MCHFSADIRIGFTEPLYQFHEPEADNVTANLILVKNRQSEQTFLVAIMLANSQMLRPATLINDETTFDYRVNNGTATFTSPQTLELIFPPNIQNLSFSLTLNSDEDIEGVEGFQAAISLSNAFMVPVVGQAYQSTVVQIMDGDCKLMFTNFYFCVQCLDSVQPSFHVLLQHGPIISTRVILSI